MNKNLKLALTLFKLAWASIHLVVLLVYSVFRIAFAIVFGIISVFAKAFIIDTVISSRK